MDIPHLCQQQVQEGWNKTASQNYWQKFLLLMWNLLSGEVCTSLDVKRLFCLGLWRGEKDLHLVFLLWKSKLSNEMTIGKLKTHISYWNNTKYQMWTSSRVFLLSDFKDARMCLYPNQITDPTSTLSVYQLNNWLPFLYLSYLKWFASCICKNMDGPWRH